MSDKRFIDSNVAVYAYDTDEPEKQAVAQEILRRGIEEDNVLLSAQVLGEFFNVVTRKIKNPMSADEAQEAIHCMSAFRCVDMDLPMVDRAIDFHRQYQLSYWDAMIVAAAERGGCSGILSEDLNTGQKYSGILAVNPFVQTMIR